jgi:hypothetical protein
MQRVQQQFNQARAVFGCERATAFGQFSNDVSKPIGCSSPISACAATGFAHFANTAESPTTSVISPGTRERANQV